MIDQPTWLAHKEIYKWIIKAKIITAKMFCIRK